MSSYFQIRCITAPLLCSCWRLSAHYPALRGTSRDDRLLERVIADRAANESAADDKRGRTGNPKRPRQLDVAANFGIDGGYVLWQLDAGLLRGLPDHLTIKVRCGKDIAMETGELIAACGLQANACRVETGRPKDGKVTVDHLHSGILCHQSLYVGSGSAAVATRIVKELNDDHVAVGISGPSTGKGRFQLATRGGNKLSHLALFQSFKRFRDDFGMLHQIGMDDALNLHPIQRSRGWGWLRGGSCCRGRSAG